MIITNQQITGESVDIKKLLYLYTTHICSLYMYHMTWQETISKNIILDWCNDRMLLFIVNFLK